MEEKALKRQGPQPLAGLSVGSSCLVPSYFREASRQCPTTYTHDLLRQKTPRSNSKSDKIPLASMREVQLEQLREQVSDSSVPTQSQWWQKHEPGEPTETMNSVSRKVLRHQTTSPRTCCCMTHTNPDLHPTLEETADATSIPLASAASTPLPYEASNRFQHRSLGSCSLESYSQNNIHMHACD